MVAQERGSEHRAELEGELKLKDAELDGLSAKVWISLRTYMSDATHVELCP